MKTDPAFRLEHVKVNRVRANGEGMGCTQRELQQPCSGIAKQLRQITILTKFLKLLPLERLQYRKPIIQLLEFQGHQN